MQQIDMTLSKTFFVRCCSLQHAMSNVTVELQCRQTAALVENSFFKFTKLCDIRRFQEIVQQYLTLSHRIIVL